MNSKPILTSLLLCAVLLITACDKEHHVVCDDVTITLTNDLGFDLDKIILHSEEFALKSGATSHDICIDQILMDPVIPVIQFDAFYGSNHCMSMYSYFCATGMVNQNSGVFHIRLTEIIPPDFSLPCLVTYTH